MFSSKCFILAVVLSGKETCGGLFPLGFSRIKASLQPLGHVTVIGNATVLYIASYGSTPHSNAELCSVAFVLVLNAKPYKRQAVSPVPANSTSGLEEHPTGSLGTPMDEIPAAEVAAAPVPAGSVPSNPPSVNSSFQQDDADLPAHL